MLVAFPGPRLGGLFDGPAVAVLVTLSVNCWRVLYVTSVAVARLDMSWLELGSGLELAPGSELELPFPPS